MLEKGTAKHYTSSCCLIITQAQHRVEHYEHLDPSTHALQLLKTVLLNSKNSNYSFALSNNNGKLEQQNRDLNSSAIVSDIFTLRLTLL